MSLYVWLELDNVSNIKHEKIFVRENGRTVEITREEWERRNPGREPFTVSGNDNRVYHANITPNMSEMASAAGIYECLWNPESLAIIKAEDLVIPLQYGISVLLEDPEKFKLFNPKNGWGDYEGFVSFCEEYLEACKRYPEAKISVWR